MNIIGSNDRDGCKLAFIKVKQGKKQYSQNDNLWHIFSNILCINI
jgi:hypothetical protein